MRRVAVDRNVAAVLGRLNALALTTAGVPLGGVAVSAIRAGGLTTWTVMVPVNASPDPSRAV